VQIDNLIAVFDLDEEVAQFVYRKVRELVDTWPFSFRGDFCPCEGKTSHVPHLIEQYFSARHGPLERYCLGCSGSVEDTELIIVIEASARDCAELPDVVRGFWFTK
jgi:hypothetical protein